MSAGRVEIFTSHISSTWGNIVQMTKDMTLRETQRHCDLFPRKMSGIYITLINSANTECIYSTVHTQEVSGIMQCLHCCTLTLQFIYYVKYFQGIVYMADCESRKQ